MLLVTTFNTIDEPRPFGDAIRFHSDKLSDALKDCTGIIRNAKDGANYAMEQLQLPFQLRTSSTYYYYYTSAVTVHYYYY